MWHKKIRSTVQLNREMKLDMRLFSYLFSNSSQGRLLFFRLKKKKKRKKEAIIQGQRLFQKLLAGSHARKILLIPYLKYSI